MLCVFSNLRINGQQTIRFLVSKNVNVSFDALSKPTFNSSTLGDLIISNNLQVKRSFPAAEGINHPLAEKVLRYYEFTTNNNLDFELQNLRAKSEIELIEEVNTDPIIITNGQPCPTNDPSDADWNLSRHSLTCVQEAHCITQGSPDIKIAIIDNGFNPNHPELIGKVDYVEPGAANGECHGTQTAFTAAGATNNGFGLSSSGYNCRLLLYLWNNPFNDMLDAANRGARIISNSWFNGCSPVQSEQNIINLVTDLGVIIVASASNGPTQLGKCGNGHAFHYPASYNNVITVSSVGHYGDMETTYNFWGAPYNPPLVHTQNCSVEFLAQGFYVYTAGCPNTPFEIAYGTSFAGPHVAGIIGLILSVNPCLKYEDVVNIIQSTSKNVSQIGNNQSYYPNCPVPTIPCAEQAVIMAQTYKSPTIYITSNITWDDKVVFGDVEIENGATLTITGIVKFGAESRLIVKKDATLNLTGGVLTKNSCADQWQGVVVEGNGSAQSGAGKVYMSNSAIIENAKNGISMNPSHIPWPALANSWGGLVEATNSSISNCDRAVEFMQMDDDNSYFHNCTFSNLEDGITLWDNENVDIIGCTFSSIQNSAILAYDSRIDAYNNTITGSRDGIEVVSTIGTSYGSNIIGNTINTSRDGVYMMAQNSASELQMEHNNIYSNKSGITLEGESTYFIDHNNIVGSQYATRFWASGVGINHVTNNTFSSADWGNLANYQNSPEFKDNCYGGNGKDLEVNSGSIYLEQGDYYTVAGNCFSKGSTPAITAVNNVPFIYWILPVKDPTCRTPQDYLNPVGYNIDYGQFENPLTCVEPTIIKYRKCTLPKTKAEGDKMEAEILAEIKKLENDKEMDPELKKYLINRYKACLKKIRQAIVIIIIEDDGTKGRIQVGKDAAAYAKSTGDLSLQAIGFGILTELNLLEDAQLFLNSLKANVDNDAIDFVSTQEINLGYMVNKGNYQLSPNNRAKLEELGNKTTPISGYARSLYYKLTGEKLPITFIHSERNAVPRSITEKQSNSNIKTYPNPVQGNVYHIDITESYTNAIFQVKIYNLQGILIQKSEIKGNGQHDVDISAFNTGMYLLSIESSGINVYNTKFVKI